MLSLSACSMFELGGQPAAPEFPPPPPQSQPEPPPRAEPATPAEVRGEIWRWFLAAKYQPFQAAALLEHAQAESGFRPCAHGPGGFHYTFQWSSTRLRQLQQFAGTQDCPPLAKQLAFADRELRNDPKFACFWDATTESAAYRALRRGFGGGSC